MSLSSPELLKAVAALRAHEMDGLRLFRPTDLQKESLLRMVSDNCFEILIVAGNRAGKSVLAAAFFASFVRDEPITCWDGTKIHCRPERLRGQAVNTWMIGDHLKHIGQTLYRLLFDPEASKRLFKIIKDKNTGAWRAWQPEMFEGDWDRKPETRWNPPIIPPSIVKEVSWAHKADHEFRVIRLTNDTTIHAFASSAEVKQGDPVDLIWNDENIVNKWYYQEWVARLRDDEGKIMWSTIPRDECYVFNGVIDRMELHAEEVESGERSPEELHSCLVHLSYLDSPFIPDRQKELALEQAGDRDAMVRIYGKRSSRLIAVYQDFSPNYHCAWYSETSKNDAVSNILENNNWQPPADWTRELILDPGTQKPAILLGAIPPPNLWDEDEPYFVCYGEVFVRRMKPMEMAQEVMRREKNYRFERFIIDDRMGRQRPPGFVETVAYQYTKAFRAVNLKSVQTEFDFIAGDDDFSRRSKQVINAMRSRPCGRPQLRIVVPACPNLVRQLTSNVRKTTPDGEAKEEAADNQVDDLRVCLEYWISRRPSYITPPTSTVDSLSPAQQAFNLKVLKRDEKKSREPKRDSHFIGIPA